MAPNQGVTGKNGSFKKIAGGLIMIFGGKRRQKSVFQQVIPDKKRVYAGNVTANEAIALCAPHLGDSLQGGTHVIGHAPFEIRVVPLRYAYRRGKLGIVFDNDDSWPHDID